MLALYAGLLRIPVRYFFSVTGVLVLLLAAGLAGQMAGYLVQADLLPSLRNPLWDTSWLLGAQSPLGSFLHVLIGYDPRPSAMQMVFYVVTLVLILSGEKLARLMGKHWDRGDQIGREALKTNNVPTITADAAFISALNTKIGPLEDAWYKLAAEKGVDGKKVLAEFRAEIKKVEAGN